MDEIDIYNYLNKHKLKKFNAKKYAKELARVYECSENCIIVYRAYFGANGDKGYKFYIK